MYPDTLHFEAESLDLSRSSGLCVSGPRGAGEKPSREPYSTTMERAAGEDTAAGETAGACAAGPKVVRRQRELIRVEGPPWNLLSPRGLLYTLLESELEEFCDEFVDEGVELKNIKHLLGIKTEGMNTDQPKHVKFWQPLELVQYLRRVGSTDPNEIVPVLGGRGRGGVDYFLEAVAKTRTEKDMPFSNGTQLKRLLAKTSDVGRADNYRWERAPPPEHPLVWHPRGRLSSQACCLALARPHDRSEPHPHLLPLPLTRMPPHTRMPPRHTPSLVVQATHFVQSRVLPPSGMPRFYAASPTAPARPTTSSVANPATTQAARPHSSEELDSPGAPPLPRPPDSCT